MADHEGAERITIESSGLSVQRRRPISGLVGFASFALFLLPLVIMMMGGGLFGMQKPDGWASFVSASWLTASGLVMVALGLRGAEAARKGRLTIADGELVLERGRDRVVVPQDQIVGGSVTPHAGAGLLTLSLADGRFVTAEVPSADAGARALEALRIDPLGRPLVARLRAGALRAFGGLGAGMALMGLGAWMKDALDLRFAVGVAWTVLFFALTAGWLLGTRPPEVAVGADGVRIRRRATSTFIPLEQVAAARVEGLRSVVIERRDGTSERVEAALGNLPMLRAIVHRLGRAIQGAEAAAAETRLALLGRGERTFEAWRAALRGSAQRPDYRRAVLTEGDLERIVGSSGATVEHRIGAAIALREAGSGDARERIRIAAEQCVSPRVRVALERIAEGGGEGEGEAEARAVEEAVEEALEEARGEARGEAQREGQGAEAPRG